MSCVLLKISEGRWIAYLAKVRMYLYSVNCGYWGLGTSQSLQSRIILLNT